MEKEIALTDIELRESKSKASVEVTSNNKETLLDRVLDGDTKVEDKLAKICLGGKEDLDYNYAVENLHEKAGLEKADALFVLACLCLGGKYVEQDINKVLEYLEKADGLGSKYASCVLGLMYLDGKFAKQDINKVLEYLEKADGLGSKHASYALGNLYMDGKFVEQDTNKGVEYFEKADGLGSKHASCALGNLYMDGKFVEQDTNKGLEYMEKAVGLGSEDALYDFGVLYIDGKDVECNFDKAFECFQNAASLCHNWCQFIFGKVEELDCDSFGIKAEVLCLKVFADIHQSYGMDYTEIQKLYGFCNKVVRVWQSFFAKIAEDNAEMLIENGFSPMHNRQRQTSEELAENFMKLPNSLAEIIIQNCYLDDQDSFSQMMEAYRSKDKELLIERINGFSGDFVVRLSCTINMYSFLSIIANPNSSHDYLGYMNSLADGITNMNDWFEQNTNPYIVFFKGIIELATDRDSSISSLYFVNNCWFVLTCKSALLWFDSERCKAFIKGNVNMPMKKKKELFDLVKEINDCGIDESWKEKNRAFMDSLSLYHTVQSFKEKGCEVIELLPDFTLSDEELYFELMMLNREEDIEKAVAIVDGIHPDETTIDCKEPDEVNGSMRFNKDVIGVSQDNMVTSLETSNGEMSKSSSLFEQPGIYNAIPASLENTLKIDENLLMQYFRTKYLEGFRQIANSIDDNSTQYAFIYMLLLSRCFNVEKILDACVPKIKDSINSKLEIDGADSKWKEFWSKKKETCECELDKMKSLNELLENNQIDSVDYNKKCWKIIKVIGLDIFGLLFNRDIDQALKEAPAFSTAERQMFKRFVIDEDFDVTPKDITSQFIADYQLVYDIEKQKEYWLGVNQLSQKKRKKLKNLFGEK